MTACVEIRGAGKTYTSARGPVTALTGVDIDVREGEFLSLLGPSGCGKSTLLRCIAGLDDATQGEIRVRGTVVARPPDRLGMVFQRDVLLDWRSIRDNVLLAAEFQGLSRRQFAARAQALLERFGLGDFADRHPWELSGGMRQRAAICRALLCEPEILLMDEPFGALDAQTRAHMQSHLLDIWRNIDITVVFITHDLDEAIHLADRILVLKPHPGQVQELIEVPVPRPRQPSQWGGAEFRATKARLEALINPAQISPPAATDGPPSINNVPMIRLTDVADNVE